MTAISARTRNEPSYCRVEAYQLFIAQLPHLRSTEGLLRAATAVSMHALDDVDPQHVENRLRVYALRVLERSPSKSLVALQANLHEVLFDEEGFAGNLEQYYTALNSYLPAVLNSRYGLPVTLALIYKAVAHWSGLCVEGINAPGHFLVRVRCDRGWMIVDPFFGGQVLSQEEAFVRLERVAGKPLPRCEQMLACATHHQWLARIIGNLRHLFALEDRRHDLAAMEELNAALQAAETAAG